MRSDACIEKSPPHCLPVIKVFRYGRLPAHMLFYTYTLHETESKHRRLQFQRWYASGRKEMMHIDAMNKQTLYVPNSVFN